jgi:hypothetical protein
MRAKGWESRGSCDRIKLGGLQGTNRPKKYQQSKLKIYSEMEQKERETKCQLQAPRIQNNLEKRRELS